MKDQDKSKDRLINELNALRQRVTQLENLETEYERVQESHRESKRKLSTLIGNLPGMAYRCMNDENWTMEFISEGCLELTGFKAEDLIGNRRLSYNELIHPDDRRAIWDQIQSVLALRQSFRVVYRIRTAAGEEKWVWEQGVGIFNDRGELLALEGFVTDITEQRRAEEALQKTYKEVTSLNRAKDKAISHLSHELKTPLSVLSLSLNLLARKLENLPQETWKATIDRANRNLERIMEIQYEAEDIMQDKEYRTYDVLSMMLDQCTDELEALVASEVGEDPVIERLRAHINEIFGPKETVSVKIILDEYVMRRLEDLRPSFSQRKIDIITHIEHTLPIYIPQDALQKIVDGLVRNAIENTPDEGKIEIIVKMYGGDPGLVVHDFGVGITEEHASRIFEGFYTTHDTIAYSSKSSFDFNAGGRGADLLRTKIFSERYGFRIDMNSSRCRFIPEEKDICPGRISECMHCTKKEDCYDSGGTTFSLRFPSAQDWSGNRHGDASDQ